MYTHCPKPQNVQTQNLHGQQQPSTSQFQESPQNVPAVLPSTSQLQNSSPNPESSSNQQQSEKDKLRKAVLRQQFQKELKEIKRQKELLRKKEADLKRAEIELGVNEPELNPSTSSEPIVSKTLTNLTSSNSSMPAIVSNSQQSIPQQQQNIALPNVVEFELNVPVQNTTSFSVPTVSTTLTNSTPSNLNMPILAPQQQKSMPLLEQRNIALSSQQKTVQKSQNSVSQPTVQNEIQARLPSTTTITTEKSSKGNLEARMLPSGDMVIRQNKPKVLERYFNYQRHGKLNLTWKCTGGDKFEDCFVIVCFLDSSPDVPCWIIFKNSRHFENLDNNAFKSMGKFKCKYVRETLVEFTLPHQTEGEQKVTAIRPKDSKTFTEYLENEKYSNDGAFLDEHTFEKMMFEHEKLKGFPVSGVWESAKLGGNKTEDKIFHRHTGDLLNKETQIQYIKSAKLSFRVSNRAYKYLILVFNKFVVFVYDGELNWIQGTLPQVLFGQEDMFKIMESDYHCRIICK